MPAPADAQPPRMRLPAIDTGRAGSCDFIAAPDESHCLLPFPDDYYTRADAASPTGRRIDFQPDALPANADGVRIDPQPYNAADGFSQGSTIVLKVPGIDTVGDVAANGLVPINHIGRYADADQRVVVIDARSGERWPIWAEIDSNATDPSKAALEIHPAKNFDSGGHYIVALRDLHRADGSAIEAPAAFRYLRDEIPSAATRGQRPPRRATSRSSAPCAAPASAATASIWPGTSPPPATATGTSGRSRCETRRSRRSATRRWPTGSSRARRRSSRSPRSRTSRPGRTARSRAGSWAPIRCRAT